MKRFIVSMLFFLVGSFLVGASYIVNGSTPLGWSNASMLIGISIITVLFTVWNARLKVPRSYSKYMKALQAFYIVGTALLIYRGFNGGMVLLAFNQAILFTILFSPIKKWVEDNTSTYRSGISLYDRLTNPILWLIIMVLAFLTTAYFIAGFTAVAWILILSALFYLFLVYKYMSIFLLVVLLPACNNDYIDVATRYNVDQGQHYFKRDGKNIGRPTFYNNAQISFDAKFTSSCLYTPFIGEDALDINKLYGISDCNTLNHQENSARFGWRHTGTGTVEVMAYAYINNERVSQSMGYVNIGQWYKYYISTFGSSYLFKVHSLGTVSLNRYLTCTSGSRVKPFPYFGGNRTAPNDMDIWIIEWSNSTKNQ